eukprot:784854-Rhodomonas_salina.1
MPTQLKLLDTHTHSAPEHSAQQSQPECALLTSDARRPAAAALACRPAPCSASSLASATCALPHPPADPARPHSLRLSAGSHSLVLQAARFPLLALACPTRSRAQLGDVLPVSAS